MTENWHPNVNLIDYCPPHPARYCISTKAFIDDKDLHSLLYQCDNDASSLTYHFFVDELTCLIEQSRR